MQTVACLGPLTADIGRAEGLGFRKPLGSRIAELWRTTTVDVEKGKCDESDVVLARSQSHQFFSAIVYSTALRVERRVAGGMGFRKIRRPYL